MSPIADRHPTLDEIARDPDRVHTLPRRVISALVLQAEAVLAVLVAADGEDRAEWEGRAR